MLLKNRRVAIAYKETPEGRKGAEEAALILRDLGIDQVTVDPEDLRAWSSPGGEQGLSEIPEVDYVLVLGGDGTLLAASRVFCRLKIPVLGVNMGGLGFITSISDKSMEQALRDTVDGRVVIERRTMLKCSIKKSNNLNEFNALNDVVIHKGGALARIIDLSVNINEEELTVFRADGLIISTPTGSTAYNLSAGGPIVHPSLNAFILTPICPFTLTNRPLMVTEDSIIRIELSKKLDEPATITIDGQVGIELSQEDKVYLSKSDYEVSLIRPIDFSFYKVLKHKLGWGGSTVGVKSTGK